MAEIRPFSAYRPAPGLESRIAALPYDVYNREEAVKIVAKNPDSFLAIDRAETGFGSDVDTYAPQVYERAAKLLQDWIEQGKFVRDQEPCYYLYELTMDGRSQTGIVACASIDDYRNQVIKKHENTRADKEQDRIRHVDVCNMQTGPIFLAYRADEALDRMISEEKKQRPVYDFVSEDGIGHRVWVIAEKGKIDGIREAFEKLGAVYIADGHHRCASAVKVGQMRREANPDFTGEEEFNYFLSVLFPDEELHIMDYNRVVKDLNGYTAEEFLNRVSENFLVEHMSQVSGNFLDGHPNQVSGNLLAGHPNQREEGLQTRSLQGGEQTGKVEAEGFRAGNFAPYHPEKKGTFGMYLEGKWYRLTAKEHIISEDAVEGLDVSLLQNYLLGPILGIQDPKTDKRIDFVGGIRGLEELERRVHTDMKVAFSMYPTSIGELFAVADAGRLMPPKSTWFEPKLRSGLFLHSLG